MRWESMEVEEDVEELVLGLALRGQRCMLRRD